MKGQMEGWRRVVKLAHKFTTVSLSSKIASQDVRVLGDLSWTKEE